MEHRLVVLDPLPSEESALDEGDIEGSANIDDRPVCAISKDVELPELELEDYA